MKSPEVYRSASGEVFEIFAVQELKPLGDYRRLYFRIVPSSDKEKSWSCVVQVSGPVLAVYENSGSAYELLMALGILRIEQAIDAGERFAIYNFTSYEMEDMSLKDRDRLLAKLRELRRTSSFAYS